MYLAAVREADALNVPILFNLVFVHIGVKHREQCSAISFVQSICLWVRSGCERARHMCVECVVFLCSSNTLEEFSCELEPGIGQEACEGHV